MARELWLDTTSSGDTTNALDISPYLIEYKVLYPKLWSSDTGRNMNGENKGTLVGIFTKLSVTIGQSKLTPTIVTDILRKLEKPSCYVKYYDPRTRTMKTESFYFGDIETSVLSLKDGRTAVATFSVIANKKR